MVVCAVAISGCAPRFGLRPRFGRPHWPKTPSKEKNTQQRERSIARATHTTLSALLGTAQSCKSYNAASLMFPNVAFPRQRTV
jgi:hypothetical protein